MCCMRLAENTGHKNYAKNRHLRTIAQLCQAASSQVSHVSTIGKKLLNGNIFMAALWNRTGHYIFMLWFLSIFFLAPNLSGRRLDVYHTRATWCGPSANLECRPETCCARLAENRGRKKVAKNRHLGTIAQLCRAISSQLRYVSSIGKKLVISPPHVPTIW